MKARLFLLAALGVCVFTFASSADDWAQWRGPRRNGISGETGLLQQWPRQGPKLLWQVRDAGEGYATPAVKGERLYVISSKGKDEELVQARAIKDGQLVWARRLGKVGPNQMAPYPGARSTPTVDGEQLYALGSDGDLVCLNAADGTEVWRKNLRADFGGQPGFWAYAESPLIDGDVLICTPGGQDATLVALDKKTGSEVWRSAVPGGDKAAYASIVIVEFGGLKQYVQFLAGGVIGVEAKSGKFLWRYGKTAENNLANIATPVSEGGFVYSSTGKGGGGLVKLTVGKDEVVADQVYNSLKNLPTSIGGAIVLDHFLYGTNGNGLMCVEFTTGLQKWQQEPKGGPGAICYADGRLYLHGEDGSVTLVVATPEAYREVGAFAPPDQPKHGNPSIKAWTYPVVADGRLYLRDQGMLWCYDVKK